MTFVIANVIKYNVLYAVMALLSELDEQHLAIVREDCDARLQASGK